MLKLLLLITHADGSHVSIAIIRVCDSVCLSVCLSVRTIKPKRPKLKSPNLAHGYSPSGYLAHQLILGQKVKGQGHKVQKDDRVASVIELCSLSSVQPLDFFLFNQGVDR